MHGVPIAYRRHGFRHNNPIERHNSDIKQRCKVMRHLKSFASAEASLKLRACVYSFVRHGGEETPAERAGISLGLGRDRLADLVRIS
ncbi:MAG: hypothetical protein AB1744_12985, partial [Candidatus Zixiibacteriota bacterium]